MVLADVHVSSIRNWSGDSAEALDGGLSGPTSSGTITLGGYVADESDVDIVRGCQSTGFPAEAKLLVANAVLDRTTGVPEHRGLEFTLYRQKVAWSPAQRSGLQDQHEPEAHRMPRSVHLGQGAEAGVLVGPRPGHRTSCRHRHRWPPRVPSVR